MSIKQILEGYDNLTLPNQASRQDGLTQIEVQVCATSEKAAIWLYRAEVFPEITPIYPQNIPLLQKLFNRLIPASLI